MSIPPPKRQQTSCRVVVDGGTRCCICNTNLYSYTLIYGYDSFPMCNECRAEEQVFY